MTLLFKNDNDDFSAEICAVISGPESCRLGSKVYLILTEGDQIIRVFVICYEYHCSPFKQAEILGNLLAVGFEGHFYLFDLLNNRNILCLKMDGYFCQFYRQGDILYLAGAYSIYCISNAGTITWQSPTIGVDGVIIKEIDQDKIYGSGECDPPGVWRDFAIDKRTGSNITDLLTH